MCGSASLKTLGIRLNRSQGRRPRSVTGIAVSVMKCRDCGLILTNPQPMPVDLADHYCMDADDYFTVPEWSPAYFSEEIARIRRFLPAEAGLRALDIGAGTGLAMRSLNHAGFDTWGIEPSESFHRVATVHVDGDRLQLASLMDAEFGPESFDFIAFRDVLEHLPFPSAGLEKALGWLKPGGIIYAHVPSTRWLIAKLVNAYYRLRGTNYVTHLSPMHPPFHLFEFSEESFRRNGNRLGYQVVEMIDEVCDVTFAPRHLKPLLGGLMEATSTGMMLAVYLRRT
jgi:SAM-dependent methyltransferase